MFFFFAFFSFSYTKKEIPNGVSTPYLPSFCEEEIDISRPLLKYTLESNKKYCIASANKDLLINSNPIKIQGYSGKIKKMEGTGIFAVLEKCEDRYFVLSSSNIQYVDIYPMPMINKNFPLYISTNENVKSVRFFEEDSRAYFIHVGQRFDIDAKFSLQGTEAEILVETFDYLDENIEPIKITEKSKVKDHHFSTYNYLVATGSAAQVLGTIDSQMIVSVTSSGEKWLNPIEGRLKSRSSNHVYDAEDFKKVRKISIATICGIVLGIVILIIVVGYYFISKKKKQERQRALEELEAQNESPPTDVGNVPAGEVYPQNTPNVAPYAEQLPPNYENQMQPQYGEQMQPQYVNQMQPQYVNQMQSPYGEQMQNPYTPQIPEGDINSPYAASDDSKVKSPYE